MRELAAFLHGFAFACVLGATFEMWSDHDSIMVAFLIYATVLTLGVRGYALRQSRRGEP